jgi:hypothetical protein
MGVLDVAVVAQSAWSLKVLAGQLAQGGAGQRYILLPPIFTTISSRSQRTVGQ